MLFNLLKCKSKLVDFGVYGKWQIETLKNHTHTYDGFYFPMENLKSNGYEVVRFYEISSGTCVSMIKFPELIRNTRKVGLELLSQLSRVNFHNTDIPLLLKQIGEYKKALADYEEPYKRLCQVFFRIDDANEE